jgi:hypothetical protein
MTQPFATAAPSPDALGTGPSLISRGVARLATPCWAYLDPNTV